MWWSWFESEREWTKEFTVEFSINKKRNKVRFMRRLGFPFEWFTTVFLSLIRPLTLCCRFLSRRDVVDVFIVVRHCCRFCCCCFRRGHSFDSRHFILLSCISEVLPLCTFIKHCYWGLSVVLCAILQFRTTLLLIITITVVAESVRAKRCQ